MFDIYLHPAGGGWEVFKCGRLSNLGTGAVVTAPSIRKQILACRNHHHHHANLDEAGLYDDRYS